MKGVYFSVGGTPREQLATAPGHHSPLFRIEPEPSVKAGVEAMVVGADALMPPPLGAAQQHVHLRGGDRLVRSSCQAWASTLATRLPSRVTCAAAKVS